MTFAVREEVGMAVRGRKKVAGRGSRGVGKTGLAGPVPPTPPAFEDPFLVDELSDLDVDLRTTIRRGDRSFVLNASRFWRVAAQLIRPDQGEGVEGAGDYLRELRAFCDAGGCADRIMARREVGWQPPMEPEAVADHARGTFYEEVLDVIQPALLLAGRIGIEAAHRHALAAVAPSTSVSGALSRPMEVAVAELVGPGTVGDDVARASAPSSPVSVGEDRDPFDFDPDEPFPDPHPDPEGEAMKADLKRLWRDWKGFDLPDDDRAAFRAAWHAAVGLFARVSGTGMSEMSEADRRLFEELPGLLRPWAEAAGVFEEAEEPSTDAAEDDDEADPRAVRLRAWSQRSGVLADLHRTRVREMEFEAVLASALADDLDAGGHAIGHRKAMERALSVLDWKRDFEPRGGGET